MKSSFVLASLLSLAVAGPIAVRDDPCACEYMCIQQDGKQCECEIDAKNKCYEAQVAAGLSCPKPTISELCQTMSILPIDLPTPTPGLAKKQQEVDPCACDYMCPQELGLGCECEKNAKEKCYQGQVSAGLNCPKPTLSEPCQTMSILPVIAATATSAPTPTPTFSQEGGECGTFRGVECDPDAKLICVIDEPNCADCPGICRSAICGGLLGILCPDNFECVTDQACAVIDSDCQGLCKAK